MEKNKPISGKVKKFLPGDLEKRREKAAAAFVQKREQIAIGVLLNLLHSNATEQKDPEQLTSFSIEVADKLIEKLYFKPTSKEE